MHYFPPNRYRKPADWNTISAVAAAHPQLPLIGNGDVLTHYDVQRRFQQAPVHAVMTGRAALIRPWLFQEFKEVGVGMYTTTGFYGINLLSN
jgi:tRNA-dihydrouridine synthase 3